MTFWEFADKQMSRVHWSMRDILALAMLAETTWLVNIMAHNPELFKVEFFKLVAQGIIMQGFLTTVLAFFFTANKSAEKDRENLGAALGVAGEAGKAAALATSVVAGTSTVDTASPPLQDGDTVTLKKD